MNGLLYLSQYDFFMAPGERSQLMCNRIQGMSLVMFYTTECAYCHNLLNVFKQLPRAVYGCQFGIVNLSVNKQIALASKNTATPITYVPYIILYIDGRPFLKYDGERDMQHLTQFIHEVSQNIHAKQQFVRERTTPGANMNVNNRPPGQAQQNLPANLRNTHPQEPHKDATTIPAYSLGKPKCEDGVCYLTYTDDKGYFDSN